MMQPIMEHRTTRVYRTFMDSPEFNLTVFALLLNFPWEVLQAPLFAGMAAAPHSTVVAACLHATLGDAAIALLAHASVALVARQRFWMLTPSLGQMAGFVAIGVGITAVIEWLATRGHWVQQWTYAPAMPVIPGTGIGLAPLLQWMIVPLVALWFVRRQTAWTGAVVVGR